MKYIKDSIQDDSGSKRILIIGNGFDLAVGRKTSYKDFYDSKYCPKHYPAPMIHSLNKQLDDKEAVRWLDLENALQEYAKNPSESDYINGDDEYAAVVRYKRNPNIFAEDKEFAAADRLIKDGKLFYRNNYGYDIVIVPFEINLLEIPFEERERQALNEIENGLVKYLNELSAENIGVGNKAVALLKDFMDDDLAAVYSFNYTKVGNLLTEDEAKANEYDAKVRYLHGSLRDGHVIIGAKDGDYGEYDFVQKAFDPNFNPPALLKDMLGAEEIVIFGHSLGDCDSQYFEPFFKRQTRDDEVKSKKITIYTYDDKSELSIKKNLNKLTDNHLSWLYSMNEFKIVKTKHKEYES